MFGLNRKILSAIILIVIVLVVLFVWILASQSQQPEQINLFFDFENGLDDWAFDSQVPNDPVTGEPVAWEIKPVFDLSFSGNSSVLFNIDGTQDDGTIWIERKLSLQPGTTKAVNVTFQLWSSSESFNTLAVVVSYAGQKNPEEEIDFQVLDNTNQVSGWKEYSFSSKVKADNTGEIYVALGISVRWETNLTYYIDAVSLKLL